MKILVIIPAYNESAIIADTIRSVRKEVPGADILVVNDASTDSTLEEVRKTGAAYLDLPSNLGIGGAVQSGFIYARDRGYDYAVQVDGDGQHDASYVLPLITWMEQEQIDVGIGSRFIENKGFQSSGTRRIGIAFLSFLVRSLFKTPIRDVTSGFRAVNRRFIEIYAEDYADDYPETTSIPTAVLHHGVIAEYPVIMRSRTTGKSSISRLKSVHYMVKVSLSVLLSKMTHSQKSGGRM